MKKIFLKENSLRILSDVMKNKLPDFLFKSVKNHDTSLGESPAFPPSNDYSFDYKLLKVRYKELVDDMKSKGFPLDVDKAENLLYKLTAKIVEMEKPFRPQLQKIVENTVNKMFAIPPETVDITCNLVDEVKPKNAIRIVPEDDASDSDDYTFKDIKEINQVDDIVKQRRFVDALIQGYSTILSETEEYYENDITALSDDLFMLINDIMTLNDYLVFAKKEKLDKKHPTLVAYVEVRLGMGQNKTIIKSQGLTFFYLLKETIRGLMELFSSHGLPKDNHKAQLIIKKADFTMAEPWDVRFGVPLWKLMFGKSHIKPNQIPFFFSQYCSMDSETFFDLSKEMLAQTEKGKAYLNDMKRNIEHDAEYAKFLDIIKQKNVDQSVLTDGYLTADDLDNCTIEEDESIEENQESEDKYDDFAQNNLNKHLIIFDKDEYPDLQSLLNGVRNHTLLIHARSVEDGSLEDLQYGLEPTIDRTILDAYASDYAEAYGNYDEYERDEYEQEYGEDEDNWPKPAEGEENWRKQMIPMVFASDDLTWCKGSRNGVIFVRSEGFRQMSPEKISNGSYDSSMGKVRDIEADGQFSDWYEDQDVPIYVEPGDFFTTEMADVVAVLNLNAPLQESISKKDKNILDLKKAQLSILLQTNPMTDDYHCGIRSISDIKTFDEAIQDDESFAYGDYSYDDAKRDLARGKVRIYSSYPIKNGTFVSTSFNMAHAYAGKQKVYSKVVPLIYVAWLNADEGEFAKVTKDNVIRENQETEYTGKAGSMGMLKSYLTMSDEEKEEDALYRHSYDIYDFITNNGYEDEFSDEELDELKDNDENDYENNVYILKKHPNILKKFISYAEKYDEDWNTNANQVMSYSNDIDINKEWLIHFTQDPGNIAYKGFTSGTEDIETLALTRRDPNMSEGLILHF